MQYHSRAALPTTKSVRVCVIIGGIWRTPHGTAGQDDANSLLVAVALSTLIISTYYFDYILNLK